MLVASQKDLLRTDLFGAQQQYEFFCIVPRRSAILSDILTSISTESAKSTSYSLFINYKVFISNCANSLSRQSV